MKNTGSCRFRKDIMNRKRSGRKIELLAPAGDLQRAKTAVLYGADAVYLGGKQFSLRSRASNFTLEDIREACAFAHERGAGVHVTVNMIPHDEDFEGLEAYLRELAELGADAVITASPAVMETAKRTAPEMEVHCSTQLSITNAEAADWLKEQLGIDRVVLGRECTMEQVRRITEKSSVDTEAFIHGGMCVNLSGRCTLSNRMTLRDANRGGCAQSCRWSYDLYDGDAKVGGETPFTMGSKDLCVPEYVYDLIEAGVSSLKIEGRMKTEYYVASIVSAYRHLIDEICASGKRPGAERMRFHTAQIMKGENREVCAGFYPGSADHGTIIRSTGNDSTVNHGFLATVLSYENGTALIETRNPFVLGDMLEVLAPGRECRVFRLEDMREESSGEHLERSRHPMNRILIPVPFEVTPGDILRRAA